MRLTISGAEGGSTANSPGSPSPGKTPAIPIAFCPLVATFAAPMEAPLEVTVTTAAQQMRDGALLLDVREPDEFAICRIAGSREIPMRQVPENLASLPRDRTILTLCHHGRRSLNVAQFLRANGFTQVSSVAGGIHAWAEEIDPGLARY